MAKAKIENPEELKLRHVGYLTERQIAIRDHLGYYGDESLTELVHCLLDSYDLDAAKREALTYFVVAHEDLTISQIDEIFDRGAALC
ncbi:MAG: hypothetical protein LBP62_03195 [Clostridiales bacterium]|jgi:hypothetical protein|nr:hypothetical protein [Clostridiales bacterium]